MNSKTLTGTPKEDLLHQLAMWEVTAINAKKKPIRYIRKSNSQVYPMIEILTRYYGMKNPQQLIDTLVKHSFKLTVAKHEREAKNNADTTT